MIQSVLLKNDVYWLGVLDPNLDVFDIIMETKYGTTYNSYLVNTTEGAILVETVKEKFFDSYLQKIEEAIGDLSQIKYIITNHTEPDHAGSIGRLVKLIPGLTVIGSKTAITYLKDILNISFNYVEGESLMMALRDIAVSSGSACTSASLEPSYVLRALGRNDELAHSSIRFTLGRWTTEEEIDYTINLTRNAVAKLRELSPLWDMFKEGIDLNTIEWSAH